MKTVKFCIILLSALIVSCATGKIIKDNRKVHFKSLANDFAAVDMALYDNNKFELKTAILEIHKKRESLTELEGSWITADSNYILIIEEPENEQLIEYFFSGWKNEESGFERLSKNKVSFPVDREILIINNVKCQKQ